MRKAPPPEPNLPAARIEPRGVKGHWQRASAWLRYAVAIAIFVAVALGFLVGVVALKRALRGPTATDRYAAQARERERELAPYRKRCPNSPETCRQIDLDKQRGEAQIAALKADPAVIRSQAYLHARDYPHEETASLEPASARYLPYEKRTVIQRLGVLHPQHLWFLDSFRLHDGTTVTIRTTADALREVVADLHLDPVDDALAAIGAAPREPVVVTARATIPFDQPGDVERPALPLVEISAIDRP
ncbi:MAG: hypothetical protein IPH80_33780 [Myxococcales bacterium]|nr:hypothetical protein [Myxococcales bacterium]